MSDTSELIDLPAVKRCPLCLTGTVQRRLFGIGYRLECDHCEAVGDQYTGVMVARAKSKEVKPKS